MSSALIVRPSDSIECSSLSLSYFFRFWLIFILLKNMFWTLWLFCYFSPSIICFTLSWWFWWLFLIIKFRYSFILPSKFEDSKWGKSRDLFYFGKELLSEVIIMSESSILYSISFTSASFQDDSTLKDFDIGYVQYCELFAFRSLVALTEKKTLF